MSVLYTNRGHFYCPHTRPILLDCNFIVDPANGNGFGVRSLKGQGIRRVWMNSTASITGTVTSSSNAITAIAQGTSNLVIGMPVQGTGIPALTTITGITSSSAVTMSANATGSHSSEAITYQAPGSPNPAAGLILVQFNDNYNRYYGGFSGFVGPTGSSSTSTTANAANVIVLLGTATLAQWLAVGLPPGITPAVGVTFIATSSASIGGSARVAPSAANYSGIDHIEVVGDPNTTIGPVPVGGSPNFGGYITLACLDALALTAPASQSTIGLEFYFGQSSVTVKGE